MKPEPLRELIITAINKEIARQMKGDIDGAVSMAIELDESAIADAVIAELPPAIPAAALVERLSAVATKMEGAMPVVVEHPSELVLVWPAHMAPLTQDQIARCRETLKNWRHGMGPLLIEGFEVRGAIRPPDDQAARRGRGGRARLQGAHA